jgi:signal transduction histidine kinase
LVLRVPADLGSIHTDAAKLMMIVRSVISNALKFTLKGTVTLTAGVAAGGATIVVADTGIGIAPEVVPIIFESFRQGDSAMTRRFGGVGLGLYIARRLLDLLGGTIAMETHVGRGSTFTIWVPDRSPLPAGAPTPDG